MPSFKDVALYAPRVFSYVQTAAANTAPPAYLFVNPANSGEYYEVVEVSAIWDVNGGASAAAFAGIVANGTALGSATTVQAANFDLTTGARTSVNKNGASLTATAANRVLGPGQNLTLVTSGTLTGLTGLVVNVTLRPIRVKQQK